MVEIIFSCSLEYRW